MDPRMPFERETEEENSQHAERYYKRIRLNKFLNFLSVTGVYCVVWSFQLIPIALGWWMGEVVVKYFTGTARVFHFSIETMIVCLLASLLVQHNFTIHKPHDEGVQP